jgi:putative Holliday junction resolvase
MSDEFPQQGRLAGIDYGSVRIGIAISDPQRILASPYENYTRQDTDRDAAYFQQPVHEERVVGWIVGLPVHTSGDESQKSTEAREFGKWLAKVTACPVRYYDERFTTKLAETLMGDSKLTKKQRKKRRDMIAAQLVLASYLESSQQELPPAPL